MKLKFLSTVLLALSLVITTQAAPVNNFDGQSLGSINGQNGWLGTAENASNINGAVVVDPVSGGADKALSISGATGGARGVYKSLGGLKIVNNSTASLTFDFMVNSGSNNQDVYFGLSNGGSTSGLAFEAYIGYVNGALLARNGSSDVLLTGFSLDQWHSIKLAVNTTTDRYDVYINNTLAASNLVFRNSTGGAQNLDLDAVRFWAATVTSSGTTRGYVDNVNITYDSGGPSAYIESFGTATPVGQRPNPLVLSWSVSGTVSTLSISPDVGDVKPLTTNDSGSVTVNPLGIKTYTLTLNGLFQQSITVTNLPPKEKLHIYLLIGQSNMQGEGQFYNASRDGPHARVLKFGSRNGMEKAFVAGTHSLTQLNAATGGNIGMGVEFGKTMIAAQTDPEVMLCLINHAMGNSAIQWWAPGVIDNKQTNPITGTNYYLYDEAIQRVRDAQAYGVLKGVLWHQGEYNSGGQTNPNSEPNLYAGRLQQLVDNLRADFNNPSLPFICGKLVPSNWVDSTGTTIYYTGGEFRDVVEAALQDLPNQRANTFCVDNNGLRGNANEMVHFDAYSQRLLGQRYAAAMINFYSDPYRLYLGGYLTPSQMANPTLTDRQADNDGDGVKNYLEFAFRSNPMVPDKAPPVAITHLEQTPRFSFTKRTDTEAPVYQVETSTNLVDWTTTGITEVSGSPVDNGNGTATVIVQPSVSAPNLFFRVRVN